MTDTNPHHQHRWAILGVLGIAQLMVVLDATIVNIALPSAQHTLSFSDDQRQWIVTAYALAFGSLLLLGGKVSDLFGRKWTFIVGLAGFGLASATGGAAQSFAMLTIARAFQGAFGALLAPAALSLLTTTFSDGAERNKAYGIYSALAGSGASIGLLLGGALTQALSWRYCMYVNLVFAAVAGVGGVALLHHRVHDKPRIDIPGAATVSLGFFALVFGFNRAQVDGWGATATIVSLAVGALLLAVFVGVEARVPHPLLPLRVIRDRNRGGSFVAMALSGAAMFGAFLFLTYYLQQNRGYSPVKTGLGFLSLTGMIMVNAVLASTVLATRVGPKVIVSVGMLFAGIGMALLTRIGISTSYLSSVLPGELMLGIGLGWVFGVAFNGATIGVELHDTGVASAVVNACQQIGGALGTALLSTIAASSTSNWISDHAGTVPPHSGLLAAASIHGYRVGFWVSAGLFAAGAVATALLYTRDARIAVPDATAEPIAAM